MDECHALLNIYFGDELYVKLLEGIEVH